MTLTVNERDDFRALELIISRGEQTFIDVGEAIALIKERKLYRDEYSTFEEYCSKRWKWSARRVYQMITAADVVNHLPPEMRTIVRTENQARELKRVPESQRPAVVSAAKSSGEPITAKSIAATAATISDPPEEQEEPQLGTDETGFFIPKHRQEIYDRKWKVEEMLRHIADVRGALRRAQDANDILFKRSPISSIMEALDRAYADLKTAVPFAVCPYCSGQTSDNCRTCLGSGFLSRFHWETAVPQELKDIRAKGIKR